MKRMTPSDQISFGNPTTDSFDNASGAMNNSRPRGFDITLSLFSIRKSQTFRYINFFLSAYEQ